MLSNQPTGVSRFGANPADLSTQEGQGHAWFRWLPSAAWARLLALFLALAGVKLALVFLLAKRLFDVHWRVAAVEPAWWDYTAFAVFVALGAFSLWRLGRHCGALAVTTVRLVNAMVLALGLCFIFLTFYVGQSKDNYLMPVMGGILDWKDLLPYVNLNLFFQSPFLGAWLFVYGLTYYFLARSRRESWMLYVTAVFAALYAALNLRELAILRNELLVADCLGVAALVSIWRPLKENPKSKIQNPKSRWLVLLPAVWCVVFAWRFFLLTPSDMGLSFIYFKLLLSATSLLFGGAMILAWRRGVGGEWTSAGLFYLASFLLLADSHHPLASNFNRLLCLGFEFPHYCLGELLLTAMVAAGAMAYCRWQPQGSLRWLDVLALILIAIALVDFRLQQIMGTRLEWHVLALGNSPKMIWRMARSYLPGLCLGLAMLTIVYALTVRGICRLLFRSSSSSFSSSSSLSSLAYALAAFLLLGLLGQILADPDKAEGQAALQLARTSPIWKRMANRTLSPEEFLRTAEALKLGDFATGAPSTPSSSPADLNVVLVFLESTYNQHLSLFGATEETQPLLSKYQDRMELFPNFFSAFASSIHARFATFTGLYPVQDYNAFTLERVPVKSIFEVLHDNGYSCSLFYSSFLDFTGFRNFLDQRGLDEIYDADTMPGKRKTEPVAWGLREEETLEAMREQIRKYGQSRQRFFLTYVPAAPHYPYEKVPEAFHKFKPGAMGDYTPLYMNELLYMDWVLASLVEQLKESGLLDKTLVVITDDHGEWLGANGNPIGHGWWLTPELVNAPLIVMDPRKPGYRLNTTIGSQVDLLPTLLDLLSIPTPSGQLYQGRSLYASNRDEHRWAYLNSMQQYAILEGNRLLLGDREREQQPGPTVFLSACTISNQGSRTVFLPENPSRSDIPISRFDDFQANLLRNYAYYCETLGKRGPLVTRTP
jgi:arylsulfatase A-like enzyme